MSNPSPIEVRGYLETAVSNALKKGAPFYGLRVMLRSHTASLQGSDVSGKKSLPIRFYGWENGSQTRPKKTPW